MTQRKRKKTRHRRSSRLTVAAPLEMRRHPGGTHVSLGSSPQLRFVELAEDLALDAAARQADDLLFDAGASSNPWSPGGRVLRTMTDPQQGLLLAGERHLAWFDVAAGRFIPAPGVQWHLAVAAESIAPYASGSVEVWFVDASDAETSSANEVIAHDWLGLGAESGDRLLVAQHLQSRRWYFVAVGQGSRAGGGCPLIEVRLSASGTTTSLASSTPAPILYDEVGIERGGAFALSGGSSPGEVTVLAAGIAEVYHHNAAAAESAPSADSYTHWWIERKSPSAATFSAVKETLTRLYHPALLDGRATGFLKHVMELAYGDTLRVQASRIAGTDTLVTDVMADGVPVNYLGVHMLCQSDTHDHAAELTSSSGDPFVPDDGTSGTPPSGPPYYPRAGTGDPRLKIAAYYRLDETGTTDNRLDSSGNGRSLRVLPATTGTISGVAGHVSTAAQIDAASEWLNRGAFGDPNPESAFRPASQMVSIAFWMTVDSLSGVSVPWANLVGLRNGSAWRLEIDESGNVRAYSRQAGPTGTPAAEAVVSTVPLGEPLFVVATFEGLAGRSTLRIRAPGGGFDQSAAGHVATPSGWPAEPTVWQLVVGAFTPTIWAAFTIEQLGIWFDGVLTPRQQDYLFAAGAGRQLF